VGGWWDLARVSALGYLKGLGRGVMQGDLVHRIEKRKGSISLTHHTILVGRFLGKGEARGFVARLHSKFSKYCIIIAALHLASVLGISQYEWEQYSAILITELGETRCRVAAERVLGSRKAEHRRKVKHVARQE